MLELKYFFVAALLSTAVAPVVGQQVGAEHQGSVPIYDVKNQNVVYEIPLPEGKWSVINVINRQSTGSTTSQLKDVRLGLIERGMLSHSLEITAKVNSNDVRWNDEPCKTPSTLYKNDYGTGLWRQKCMTLAPQTFLQKDNESTRQFLKVLADSNVKHDFNSLISTYTRYGDFGKFLIVRLHTFPSNYGLGNPVVGIMNMSPYHPSQITNSKENKEFVDALSVYSETLTVWLDSAYDGKKFNQLPRFRYPGHEDISGEVKEKLTLLEKSLGAKLITQSEFELKKSILIKNSTLPN